MGVCPACQCLKIDRRGQAQQQVRDTLISPNLEAESDFSCSGTFVHCHVHVALLAGSTLLARFALVIQLGGPFLDLHHQPQTAFILACPLC